MRRPPKVLNRVRRFAASECGTHLVEMALVLPLMLVMLGAVAEFGRFFYTYTTLAKATRAGARHLINKPTVGTEGTKARDDAKNLVVCGDMTIVTCGDAVAVVRGLKSANVEIVQAGGALASPETITVRIVNYQYQPLFDLGKLTRSTSLTLKVNISPGTTMRYLLT